MKYQDLSSIWQTQRKQYNLWEVQLVHSAIDLRNMLEAALETPKDETLTERYVDITSTQEEAALGPKSINANGELVFRISVLFDFGPNSHPRIRYYIPVAARINSRKIEYSRFDVKLNDVSDEWTADGDLFCGRLIRQLHNYFNHDPMEGFVSKSKMGFV